MAGHPVCRSCRGRSGHLVLDLGNQPACDQFPDCGDPGPDPGHPLQMWLCSACGLAQLVGNPPWPRSREAPSPKRSSHRPPTPWNASQQQAGSPVETASSSSPVPMEARGSASWPSEVLAPVADDGPADLVIDSFGMMHDPDQSAALAERAARVAPGGALVLQYHSLDTIVRLGQWNALRHGHFAYYSTSALVGMLETIGFSSRVAWRFDLYGGTVLLAATPGTRPPSALPTSP